MDYYGNRYNETFEYVKVSTTDWSEQGKYEYITDGSLELSTESDLAISGSFQFKGPEMPDPNYMMRVYYSFYDDDDNYEKRALATLYVSFSSIKYQELTNGILYTGSLTGNSVLVPLRDKKYGQPFVVKRNENAIYKAQQLISEFGLRINYIPSSKVLSADRTFQAGESYLEIVNWLCEFADYYPAYTDAEGVIQLMPKTTPEDRPDMLTFKNDDDSIMYPEVDETANWMNSANVVKLIYNTDKASAIATAKNITGSRSSLEALNNREKTYVEDIGDLGTEKKTLAEKLMDKAEEVLRKQAEEIEYVTFSHALIPMYVYEPIKIIYSDMEWVGMIDNMSISLSPSVKTQTRVKRTITVPIVIEKNCTVYRSSS